MRAQLRHRAHGGGEILPRHGRSGFGGGGVDGTRQFPLLGLAIEFGGRLAGLFGLVAPLLNAQNVGGALVAGEEIFSVLGVEEFAKRFDAADDEEQLMSFHQ